MLRLAPPRRPATASWPTAPGCRWPTARPSAVVLVNCFLFPAEVDRVLGTRRRRGVGQQQRRRDPDPPACRGRGRRPARAAGPACRAGPAWASGASCAAAIDRDQGRSDLARARIHRLAWSAHDTDRRPARRRADAVVRALPAEDRRGRASAREVRRRAGRAAAVVRVGHLRRRSAAPASAPATSSPASTREQAFPAMPHLTCVGHTRADIAELLDHYAAHGVENILALGGDPPADGSRARRRLRVRLGARRAGAGPPGRLLGRRGRPPRDAPAVHRPRRPTAATWPPSSRRPTSP